MATHAWIDRLIVNRAAGAWGWANLFTDLPFGDPNFKGARWTVQNGHYTNPADPSTFVGGSYHLHNDPLQPITAQHEGAAVVFCGDYDDDALYRNPGTDTVSFQNNNPATLWTIPDAVLADGTANPDNVFRIRNQIATPLEVSVGNWEWVNQDDWSSAVGNATPGLADHLDIVFDLSQGKVVAANVDPGTKLPGQTVPLGSWLGLDGSNNVTLATQLSTLVQAIANAGYTIPDSLLNDQKILTVNASTLALQYASGAAAANALVDSNIASVQLGKLVSGTVVFSGDIYMAGGGNGPVVRLGSSGVFLYSGSSSGGFGVTQGSPGSPSYYASGYTSMPYLAIQSTGLFAYSGSSGPSTAVTGSAVTLYSQSGNMSAPYVTLTGSAVRLSDGGYFKTDISSSGIALTYAAGVAATLTTIGLIVQNGGNFTFVGSTGVLMGYTGSYSVPMSLTQMQGASYYAMLTSTYLAFVQANGPLVYLSSGNLYLYSASTAGPTGSTTSPYVQIGASSGIKIAAGGSSYSLVATSSGLTLYSVDGSTSNAYLKLSTTTVTIKSASLAAITLDNSGNAVFTEPLGTSTTIKGNSIIAGSVSAMYYTLQVNGFISDGAYQILTKRQTGLGSPSGWADGTALAWAQSLYTKLSAHGLIT